MSVRNNAGSVLYYSFCFIISFTHGGHYAAGRA
jgi:hypothetical protein